MTKTPVLLITCNLSRNEYRAEGIRDGEYRTVYALTDQAVIAKWYSAAPNEMVRCAADIQAMHRASGSVVALPATN
ncbi:hypothetical protein [Pseudomonas iridis]|uniref:hypothetical protein n=1 Tax=Pseudomonas iridis TaxID=2710587 RepID=UPI001B329A7B|nr:hypothetical protein [Pseudomonas iridis]MBP5971028.1 hypothetical protein [Pseudomonas iridis]